MRKIAFLIKKQIGMRNVLQTEEKVLNRMPTSALYKLKDHKPELIQITTQEQIGKLAGKLTTSFIKWLVT